MPLHVPGFGGGIVLDQGADQQRTTEVRQADSYDIGPRQALVVTGTPADYLTLKDNGTPSPWTALWALLECAGFNFSKVVAIGEGDAGGGSGARYLMTTFNREGESSPYLWASGGSSFGADAPYLPILPPKVEGVTIAGADFAGVFPIRFAAPGAPPAGGTVAIRLYLVNIGAREGFAPNTAPGLYVLSVVPPDTIPLANQIGRFDSLGTGDSGLLTVPTTFNEGEGAANGGTHGRQLYPRGMLAYNNHILLWGYDANDEQIAVVTNITKAVNGVVTTAANHGRSTGDTVLFKGVLGMTEVNGNSYVITVTGLTTFQLNVNTTGFTAYASDGRAIYGHGDGPNRVMFSNLGRPLKYGNDNVAAVGVDRGFTDSDAFNLGGAGEIIRGGVVWRKRAILGTNRGLHYVAGAGRDSFLTDGATPVQGSNNIIGPGALKEGPDGMLYGIGDSGLWRTSDIDSVPDPLYLALRDKDGKSNGYWDLIWNDQTRSAASYPGQTNQDLVWMAVDWERFQVIIGIPWCSITNGFGYGTDTVVIKFNVVTGGYTRQRFVGVQYTAAGYFRAIEQQAATRMLGTATAGKATVQRFAYKATNNATLALPADMPSVGFGPYAPFGPDGVGVTRRLYLVLSWDQGAVNQVAGVTKASPAIVTTSLPHGYVSGQVVDIAGVKGMTQINGGPYTITVTGANTYSIPVDSTGFGVFDGSSIAYCIPPLAFGCTYKVDESAVTGFVAPPGGQFALSVRAAFPPSPAENDLWLDLSQMDPNIGNATAGALFAARGGYLLRTRRDNTPVAITGATRANPCVITAPSHNLSTGQRISIRNVVGMTQLNNDAAPGAYTKDYTVTVIDGDHVSLFGIDSSAFTAYSSGGTASLAWLPVPGLGMNGGRASIPVPIARRSGTRITLDVVATVLARRYQIEGFGVE